MVEYDKRREKGQNCQQVDLAQYAFSTFGLSTVPSQPCISRILRSRDSLLDANTKLTSRRRASGNCDRLEKVLVGWIKNCKANRISLTDASIREKGLSLLKTLNEKLPEEKRVTLKFSNGWVSRFKKRHSFGRWSTHSENDVTPATNSEVVADTPVQPTSNESNNRRALKDYALCDIFNAHEFGLQFTMAPDTTIAREQLKARKRDRNKFTCLACCNADGSQRLPLRFVGRLQKPRSFEGQTASQLGFDYCFNAKSWMTSTIFYEWLEQFNQEIAKQAGRKACLLVDKCSAHGKVETLPNLSCVSVVYIDDLETEAEVNTPQAEIVSAMKCRYRLRQMEQALSILEVGLPDMTKIYAVDQLQAMRWMAASWNAFPQSAIAASWKQSGVLQGHVDVLWDHTGIVSEEEDNINALIAMIAKVVPLSRRMAVDFLLKHPAEQDTVEILSDDNMVDMVLGEQVGATQDGDNEEEDGVVLPAVQEQSAAFALVRLVLSKRGLLCNDTERILGETHRELSEKRRQLINEAQ